MVGQGKGPERIRGVTGYGKSPLGEGHSGAELGREEGKRQRAMAASM